MVFEAGCGCVDDAGQESDLFALWYLQDDGDTPLHIASHKGHGTTVGALLASGAAVNQARTVGLRH